MGLAPLVAHLPPLRKPAPQPRPANHYRRLMRQFDAQRRDSIALVQTALGEGVHLIDHTVRRIARRRAEAANG